MDSFLIKFFPNVYHQEKEDKSTNQYCKFNSQLLTTFTSSLYLAALVSSLFASSVTRKFGRKWSIFGADFNGFAKNVAMLIIDRMLLGIGIGFANQELRSKNQEMNATMKKLRGDLCSMQEEMSSVREILRQLRNEQEPEI